MKLGVASVVILTGDKWNVGEGDLKIEGILVGKQALQDNVATRHIDMIS